MTVIKPNSVAGINSITVQSGNSLAIHKSNGELLRTITGTTGVTTFSSISVGAAYTDNSAAKSINIGVGASIAQHDANTLSFGTGGDERLRIDSTGNVGLGIADPNILNEPAKFQELTLGGKTEGAGIHLKDDNGNVQGGLFTSDATGAMIVRTITNHPMMFRTNNTDIARFDSSGRLLIGTSTEGQASADDLTLATSGNTGITIRSGTSNAGNIYFSDATSGTAEYAGYVSYSHSTNSLSFGTNDGTEGLRITSAGIVGVNTNSPTLNGSEEGIHIVSDSYPTLHLTNSTTQHGASNGSMFTLNNTGETIIRNGHNSHIRFDTNGSNERLRIGSSGQIGIAGANYGTSGQVLTSGGSGSAVSWTTVSGTTINGNAANRLIAGSDTANTLSGQANLTFSSDILQVSSTTQGLGAKFINTGNEYTNLQFSAARTAANNALGIINAKWNNNHEVAAIYLTAGDDTSNKDDGKIRFYTSAASGSLALRLDIQNDGNVTPGANGSQDLGSSSLRWANVYTSDLDLSNEAKGGNDVDGTWGSYTIQEGESDLFLINKRNGKKYKFNLTEVS